MPNTDFEPNEDRVNEVTNGDCINELDNELEELLDSFQKLSKEDGTNMDAPKGKKKLKHKKKKLNIGYEFPPLEKDEVQSGPYFKRNWIRNLIASDCPLFLGLQETKVDYVDHLLVHSLGPRHNIDFVFSSSIGASGGLLTMWDSSVFSTESHIINPNYLCAVGSWNGVARNVALVNVYGPQSSAEKALL
ncbi:RNA-directed DNA polymerase, eukaryota [Tanacetum coccineum]|uniref:RNA-directed DNA polymerase, eukaryota n=1 Tax=Tanacetum coccineum TaxID=301880 RepID=A0ABQ5BNA2_9ASTR